MSRDRVTKEEVSEEPEIFGEFNVEHRIEKHFDGTELVAFKVDHNKYGYQRIENQNIVVEKIIASERLLSIGIFPVAPLNVPARYAEHVMLKLTTPLVIDPKSHVDAYLSMPIEIGVVRSTKDDVQLIDAFSVGQPKYALYGIPENGIICRYYETKINSEIPKVAPYKEAALKVHFHNYTDKIGTVTRIVFPIEGADFYYRKHEAYYSDIEVIVESSLAQPTLTVDITDSEWVADRTNFRQKFDSKYVMDWGF